MRAVLALDDIEEHRHSHLISEFRRNYLKTNILDRSLSEIIGSSFQVRNESDHDDMWSISAEDVAEQIDNAQIFLSSIEGYIRTRGVELYNKICSKSLKAVSSIFASPPQRISVIKMPYLY